MQSTSAPLYIIWRVLNHTNIYSVYPEEHYITITVFAQYKAELVIIHIWQLSELHAQFLNVVSLFVTVFIHHMVFCFETSYKTAERRSE